MGLVVDVRRIQAEVLQFGQFLQVGNAATLDAAIGQKEKLKVRQVGEMFEPRVGHLSIVLVAGWSDSLI